jgi:hypothetical protein
MIALPAENGPSRRVLGHGKDHDAGTCIALATSISSIAERRRSRIWNRVLGYIICGFTFCGVRSRAIAGAVRRAKALLAGLAGPSYDSCRDVCGAALDRPGRYRVAAATDHCLHGIK